MSETHSAPLHRLRLWLIALVVFAAAVRLIGINFDSGHWFHPDERRIAFAVEELSFQPLQLNPHFFAYGSLPLYVSRVVSSGLGLIDERFGHYDSVIVTGRAVSAVMGVLTVILIVFFGIRLYNPQVGLLAGFLLAACVLHVQNSHYMTTDVFLTFLVTLALYCMVGIVQRGRPRDWIFSGIVIGLAAATKFSALPLLAPLAVAAVVRLLRGDGFFRVLGLGLLATLCIVLAFACGMPYAFLDFANYYRDVDEQSRMVRNAGLLPYTNQYIGVPKYGYDLTQLVLWGMAPPLGLAAIWATGARVVGAVRERSAIDFVLLAWVIPFFLITGSFDVKFVRYLLPIYPIMILWASAWLWRLAQRGLLGRIVMWFVVIATGLSALAFLNIYTRPHTVVTASEWTFRHIPAGKTILTQHWDEGFPMPMPMPGGNPGKYKVIDLPYYEPDTPRKWKEISEQLAGADYIAFQTKRLYGALTMAPAKYPISNKYFYSLFAGDLGYKPIYDHASRPGLFGIEFPDELADESITVYDHPKVIIFENTGRLSADEIYQRIMQGLPSRKLTRTDILLARASDSGAAAAPDSPPVRSSLIALLWFVVVVQLIGMSAFAVLRRALPVPGVYALSKVIGILTFSWLPWLLTSFGETAFTRGTLAVMLAAMILAGLFAWRRGRGDAVRSSEWWPTDVMFWGVFALFLAVRSFNPEVFWGEKPMDFSFLNALTRATTLPPPEPWFSGSTLHYTYFGQYIVAALGKLCHIHPGITFNLGIALFGALTAMGAFALGCAISARRGVGLLAAVFVVLIGNLAGLREIIARRVVNFDYFWATSRVIKDTINEYPFWSFLFADLHAHVLVMPFSLSFLAVAVWWARRDESLLPARPSLLFLLLAFLLGAIMVTNGWSSPTYILFLPFLLGCIQWARQGIGRARVAALIALALLAIAVVALRVAAPGWPETLVGRFGENARELYSIGLLACVGLAVLVAIPGPAFFTAATVGVAYLLYWPFWSDFEAPARNFGLEDQSYADFWDFSNIFGLFLFIAVPFLFVLWRRSLQGPARQRLGGARVLAVCAVAAIIFGCWLLSLPLINQFLPASLGLRASLRIGTAVLSVLALSIALQRRLSSSQRIATIMLSFAFAITAGTDFVFVWDRMNTIFKFYLEAWFLLAVASAVAVVDLWQGLIRSPWLRRVWQMGVVILLALSLFTAATGLWGVANTRRVQTPRPTLDGTAYLVQHSPHDRAAYEWLNENIAGIPVIAEAHGPSYQEFSRVAMNTGLPTVLGWDYHVHQRAQRWPDINKRKDDLKKLYTSDNEQAVAEILRRYHVALLYVGPLERRTYNGGNLDKFKQWSDLLQPIYSNAGASIFAVQGQFGGAIPVTTIEEVPQVQEEEVVVQGAPGKLSQPRGVAVDRDGNAYVADFGNDRIQKFDPQMQFVKAWGERGDLPGQFKQPGAVAIGADGLVYVADTWNQRVQVFTPDGEYKKEWAEKYYGPRGIAAAQNGNIYLADTGNHRVRRFGPDGTETGNWGGLGTEPGQFTEPVGIAVDKDNKVYVVDNGNARLQIFDADGKLLSSFPVEGWEQKVFSEPHVTVAPDGTIWVSVPVPRVIRAYDQSGNVLREIAGGDDLKLPFDRPMGLAFDARTNELVVVDLENRVTRVPAQSK